MHILLTNDDGPLSEKASPYIPYLVKEIVKKGWKLSIVVPSTQKSWIGKAHFAGKTIDVEYIYTKVSDDTTYDYEGPFGKEQAKYETSEYLKWTLVDSTPAACVDIAINHLIKDIDLVVSGPNFGKNSSNLYILASGTVGAAMEAVLHEKPAIAISYSYDHHPHPEYQLKDASVQAVEVIDQIWSNWNKDVELYTMNVPLGPNVKDAKAVYAPILDNKWGKSVYEPSEGKFKWNPDFVKVHKDGLKRTEHSDNQVLLAGNISVTPLKARFMQVGPLDGDVPPPKAINDLCEGICKLELDENDYLYDCIAKGMKYYDIPITSKPLTDIKGPVFHYTDYEDIDFDRIGDSDYLIPSYVYRKGLIRKHYLANTVRHYVAKNPQSILNRAVPESFPLELDYAEFLDDALDECEWLEDGSLWIVKPGMSDKGQGIRVFRTQQQLQAIFDSFEEESDDEGEGEGDDNGVIISQLREFIIQKYIPPLVLSSYGNKKFHLRVYVVASGVLKVYVNNEILVLFADSPYGVVEKETEDDDDTYIDMKGHLTNSCLQEKPEVITFDSIKLTEFEKSIIFNQICQITRELFMAAESDKINFQMLPNATEVYGIDFLVDDKLSVWLVEVNAYPDFKQSGDLKYVVDSVWRGIAGLIAEKFGQKVDTTKDLTQVLDLDSIRQH
ncbi:probable tubulin--tyrosine ligase Pby1p [[Candida] jaroonii]|uniref:Probable tubulin--tyrosine ligase Pby1p n=1 Tax=[Candida] jaroonii TaxID=467808 RepID=A0ACA9Y6M6_9ASCO|nr:probable tubulin--tyrosine ligase Pby1p [[Candida] jaroonii]